MFRKKIYHIIYTVLILLAIWILFSKSLRINENLKHSNYLLKTGNLYTKNLVNNLLYYDSIRVISDNSKIDKNIYLFFENGDSILFVDYLKKNTNILMFRYSELNCMACVDKEIDNLKKFFSDSPEAKQKVLILSSYKNIRDLFLFKKINQIPDFKILNLKGQYLGIPLEHENIPYYFTVSNSFTAINIFVPDKVFPARTRVYLNNILKSSNFSKP